MPELVSEALWQARIAGGSAEAYAKATALMKHLATGQGAAMHRSQWQSHSRPVVKLTQSTSVLMLENLVDQSATISHVTPQVHLLSNLPARPVLRMQPLLVSLTACINIAEAGLGNEDTCCVQAVAAGALRMP